MATVLFWRHTQGGKQITYSLLKRRESGKLKSFHGILIDQQLKRQRVKQLIRFPIILDNS